MVGYWSLLVIGIFVLVWVWESLVVSLVGCDGFDVMWLVGCDIVWWDWILCYLYVFVFCRVWNWLNEFIVMVVCVYDVVRFGFGDFFDLRGVDLFVF